MSPYMVSCKQIKWGISRMTACQITQQQPNSFFNFFIYKMQMEIVTEGRDIDCGLNHWHIEPK